jgi:hypothetical protein
LCPHAQYPTSLSCGNPRPAGAATNGVPASLATISAAIIASAAGNCTLFAAANKSLAEVAVWRRRDYLRRWRWSRLEFCYTKLPRGAVTAISPAGPEPHHSCGEGECHDSSHDRRGRSSQELDKMPRRSRLFRFASIKQWHPGNLKQRVGCKPKAAAQSDHLMGILKADLAQTVATCLVTAWARTQSQQPLSEGRQSIPSPLMSPGRSSFQAQGGKCPLQRQALS